MKVYYTYLVVCRDGSLYTGYTDQLSKRMRQHNCGKGAKYTRSRRPIQLLWWDKFSTKRQAMQREAAVKKWNRQQKLQLLSWEQQSKVEQLWQQAREQVVGQKTFE